MPWINSSVSQDVLQINREKIGRAKSVRQYGKISKGKEGKCVHAEAKDFDII